MALTCDTCNRVVNNPREEVKRGFVIYYCNSCRNEIGRENREPVDGMQDFEDRVF
jgi:hypothetical protein